MSTENTAVDVENTEKNTVAITTMTPEEAVTDWARENMISQGAAEKLFDEGFTSLEALKLLDKEDLSKVKIPKCQKKLILSCVQALKAAEQAIIQHSAKNNNGAQTTVEQEVCAQLPESARLSADQSTTVDGSYDVENSGAQSLTTTDSYMQGLLNQLVRRQLQAQNGLAGDISTRQTLLSDSTASVGSRSPLTVGQKAPETQSWNLSLAANEKIVEESY